MPPTSDARNDLSLKERSAGHANFMISPDNARGGSRLREVLRADPLIQAEDVRGVGVARKKGSFDAAAN